MRGLLVFCAFPQLFKVAGGDLQHRKRANWEKWEKGRDSQKNHWNKRKNTKNDVNERNAGLIENICWWECSLFEVVLKICVFDWDWASQWCDIFLVCVCFCYFTIRSYITTLLHTPSFLLYFWSQNLFWGVNRDRTCSSQRAQKRGAGGRKAKMTDGSIEQSWHSKLTYGSRSRRYGSERVWGNWRAREIERIDFTSVHTQMIDMIYLHITYLYSDKGCEAI